ncbi:MAG: phenylalanine--tRNA ligase subunit beta [Gemmataceae bacterium]
MRVPLSWLREYVALPADPGHLVERLTLAGLEAAGTELFGLPAPGTLRVKPADAGLIWEREKIVVAQVISIEKHPEADKLKMVTVDYGAATPKTVITGAPNIAPGQSGMKVILGLCGSRYYSTDKEGKKTILTLEPKALRGIMNDAMCMSNFELGIAEDHDGIIILDANDPAPGTPLQDVLGEVVIDLDILPNMARCLGLLGIAKEVAAATGGQVTLPVAPTLASGTNPDVRIGIADAKLCPRYSAVILDAATVGPAPGWMRRRLQYAGMRPINNVVDITNYVMLETGQPLHAFDYDVLMQRAGGTTPTITIRPAASGERLVTLDGQDRELTPANLVIADTAGPIALAGVMGGAATEVTTTTKTILLESASFDFVSVRKTARQFNLFSEASTRFSRGVHPAIVPQAAARAAGLFVAHAGATVRGVFTDEYPAPLPTQTIELTRTEIRRVLGFDLPEGEVERVLTALEFQLEPSVWGWMVTVPPTRLDVQAGAADLIEELARMSGYDRLPERLLEQELPVPTENRTLVLEAKLQDRLVEFGLSEVMSYSLSHPDQERHFAGAEAALVTLVNPGSPERSVLRRSLLPGLLDAAKRAFEVNARAAVFELGPVFIPNGRELPHEPRRLALALVGRKNLPAWDAPLGTAPVPFDFFDLKGILEQLFAHLKLPPVQFLVERGVPHFHPGRTATITIGTTALGHLGELHPKSAAAFGLAEKAVLIADLDAEAILRLVPERAAYRPFSTFPAAKRDLAVIVPEATPCETVLQEIRAGGSELLTGAELFDLYSGESIPAGTKSFAFALAYQALDRTLGEKEIEKLHQKIEGRLRQVLSAKIRGKDDAK